MNKVVLFALLLISNSLAQASDFCVAYWTNSFDFKEEFLVYLTSNCEGKVISTNKLFMKLTSGRGERLERQMNGLMNEMGYSQAAKVGQLYFFAKGSEIYKDICVIELSAKFRPGLTCSNKNVNTRIYLDDPEIYKVYLSSLGYHFVSETESQIGPHLKQFLIYRH